MKAKSIAKAILADHRRERSERTDITKCFMCGYGVVYRGSRFCSERCREYYVEGNPGHFQDWLQAKITYQWQDGRPMRAGQRGFHINCAHCRKEFESLGLRCCSVECAIASGWRQDWQAPLRQLRHGNPDLAEGSQGVQQDSVLFAQMRQSSFSAVRYQGSRFVR